MTARVAYRAWLLARWHRMKRGCDPACARSRRRSVRRSSGRLICMSCCKSPPALARTARSRCPGSLLNQTGQIGSAQGRLSRRRHEETTMPSAACRSLDQWFPRRAQTVSPGLPRCVCRLTTGLMSWLASPVVNERTIANRSASRASFGNDEPNVTPGMLVAISPVADRMSAGADILGSKVSNWLGPPCRNRKMTDRPVSKRFGSAAA